MKLAYITTYDARSLKGSNEWSGTGHYIAQSLKNQSIVIKYIGPLQDAITLKAIRKIKRHYYEISQQKNYQKDADPLTLKHYARQVAKKLKNTSSDIVFSATVNPIAYLECDYPIAFWADGTFAGIRNFYPQYSNLHSQVVNDWHQMEKLALEKSELAIYSSDWAAQSAIKFYQADPRKVKVVPFGANIEMELSFDTIKDSIESRSSNSCKLLFLAVDWFRKGGNIAYSVAKQLNQSGLRTELIVVGCKPLIDEPTPEFLKPLGFINKSTPEGRQRLNRLILESHFLILPSLADCTPIVFSEANSLGVPCLSTNVGGIPTIIRDNENGKLFSINSNITEYCNYIDSLFLNYSQYKELAYHSFLAYQSRLNWKVSGQKVKQLLTKIL